MSNTKIKSTCLATALLGYAAIHSSASVADDLLQDSGAWLQAVGEGNLKSLDPSLEKVRLWLEIQSRWDDNWDHWYQGLFRTAVGYSLSERATIWAGYTYLPTQNVGKASVQQQDLWPGFRYVLPTDFGTFTYRILFEANFLPGNNGDVRFRPRQLPLHAPAGVRTAPEPDHLGRSVRARQFDAGRRPVRLRPKPCVCRGGLDLQPKLQGRVGVYEPVPGRCHPYQHYHAPSRHGFFVHELVVAVKSGVPWMSINPRHRFVLAKGHLVF